MQTAPQVLKVNLLKTATICTIFPSLMFQTLLPQLDALTVLVVFIVQELLELQSRVYYIS